MIKLFMHVCSPIILHHIAAKHLTTALFPVRNDMSILTIAIEQSVSKCIHEPDSASSIKT